MVSPFQIGGPNDPWLRLKSDRLLGYIFRPFHGHCDFRVQLSGHLTNGGE